MSRWPKKYTEEEKKQAKNRSNLKYIANSTTNVSLRLFNSTDADIIAYLSGVENKNGLLKALLRRHMMEEGWTYAPDSE